MVIAASPVLSIVYAARSRAESPGISRVELENEQNYRFHTESISDFRCDPRRSTQRQRRGGNNHFLRALLYLFWPMCRSKNRPEVEPSVCRLNYHNYNNDQLSMSGMTILQGLFFCHSLSNMFYKIMDCQIVPIPISGARTTNRPSIRDHYASSWIHLHGVLMHSLLKWSF